MDQDAAAIWGTMRNALRNQSPELCRKWFDELRPEGVADGTLHIRAPSGFQRDYLRGKCVTAFNDAAQSATNSLLAIRFLGPDDDGPAIEHERPHTPGRAAERRDGTEGHNAPARPDANPAATPDRSSTRRDDPQDPGAAQPTRDTPSPARHDRDHAEPKPPAQRARPAYTSSEARPGERGGHLINPDYNFESFVAGPGNRFAHAGAMAVAEAPGQMYNPLFIHGGFGLGKTHLLQAICVRVLTDAPRAVVHYTSCDQFVTEFLDTVRGGDMANFRHRFRDVDVLVIDDIHFLGGRERTQEEFFHTFNSLFQTGRQIVLSSDAPPEEIPDIEGRLVSRFKWGLVTRVEPPTYETRVAIAQTKAGLRGLDLTREVCEFIAAHATESVREIEGAIEQLHLRKTHEGREIDLELAREAMGVPEHEPAPRATSVDAIIEIVANHYDVRRADLLGPKRHQSVSLPRQICMYLARQLTKQSLGEIGSNFGGRDHSTVIYAVRQISRKRVTEPAFDATICDLESRIARRPRES